jgi:predicted phosphodiesterase
LEEAHVRGADVVCFGHTHSPLCQQDGRLWVLNPGACGGSVRVTYGVIEVVGGHLRCRVEELSNSREPFSPLCV